MSHIPTYTTEGIQPNTKGIWPSLPESEFEDLKHTCNVHCPADMQVSIDVSFIIGVSFIVI